MSNRSVRFKLGRHQPLNSNRRKSLAKRKEEIGLKIAIAYYGLD